MIHFVWILSRTVFDTLGKTSLIFVWMTLMDEDGNFRPLLMVGLYYVMFLILVLYNIVFHTNRPSCSLQYIIGSFIFSKELINVNLLILKV